MKFSIIIPTYGHLDKLKSCCDTIIKYTDLNNVEIIVVANGSDTDTTDYIVNKGFPFKLIEFPNPIGYPKAINAGLKICSGDYIILLNNDTEILPSATNTWLNMLEAPFKTDSNCGITGPNKSFFNPLQREFLIFCCVMISRKLFERLGYLDEIFSPGSGEDLDYCFKAVDNGFKLVQVPVGGKIEYKDNMCISEFPLWHIAEVTVHEIPGWQAIFDRNMEMVTKRYKKEGSTDQLKRLNVGCGLACMEGYINVDLYPLPGAKIDAIMDAKKLTYEDGTFDEVRACHVIEHFDFHETNVALKEWCRVLKSGGKLVIETPDLLATCKAFVEGDEQHKILLYGVFFSTPWIAGQTHKFLFTETQLRTQLEWAGFKEATRVRTGNYVVGYGDSLYIAMEAYK
jgi:GT2 family glycosyltransferase/predicted SAM-dependent methyltransferase